ncbi:hypothetical protein BJX65DRAFT_256068 [Aspergillus insuetus]
MRPTACCEERKMGACLPAQSWARPRSSFYERTNEETSETVKSSLNGDSYSDGPLARPRSPGEREIPAPIPIALFLTEQAIMTIRAPNALDVSADF